MKYLAKINNKYVQIVEEEMDFTGYGGSTETHYKCTLVTDINQATLAERDYFYHALKWHKQGSKAKLYPAKKKIEVILL